MDWASVLVASSRAANTAPRGTARCSVSQALGLGICNEARRATQNCSLTPSGFNVPGGTTPTQTSATAKAPTAKFRGGCLAVMGAWMTRRAATWLAMYSKYSSRFANTPSVATSKRAAKTESHRATFGAASSSRSRLHCSLMTSSITMGRPPSPVLSPLADTTSFGTNLRTPGQAPEVPSSASATLQRAVARVSTASVEGGSVKLATLASPLPCQGPDASRTLAASNQHCSLALV
mmetsp:Transcript_15228/g.43574  ORF Transcript_15228/g.43574 Transcript_15228/m.43574 type:complete len:235 (+) Transcript_15228:170-874(+)